MKAICIDGKPKLDYNPYYLPEGIPLEVKQSPKFTDCYIVDGYYELPRTKIKFHWHKRRFIPLSDIDESEIIKERESIKELI